MSPLSPPRPRPNAARWENRATGVFLSALLAACADTEARPSTANTLVSLDGGLSVGGGNLVAAGSGPAPEPFSSQNIGILEGAWDEAVTSGSSPAGVHLFVGLDSNFCLDVPYGVPATGTVAHIYNCDLIPSAQTWTFEGGQLRIADKNGMAWCLGLAGGTLNANAPVMSPCTSAASPDPTQTWTWTGGMLRLAAANTCLSLAAAVPAPNLGLSTFACDPNNAVQQWRLASLGQSAAAGASPVPMGMRANVVSDPTLCLDLNRGETSPGIVQGYACNLGAAQKWIFEAGRISTQNTVCLAADTQTGSLSTVPCLPGSALQSWEIVGNLLRLTGTTLCLCLPAPGSAGGGTGPVGPATLAGCPTQGDDQRHCRWLFGLPPT